MPTQQHSRPHASPANTCPPRAPSPVGERSPTTRRPSLPRNMPCQPRVLTGPWRSAVIRSPPPPPPPTTQSSCPSSALPHSPAPGRPPHGSPKASATRVEALDHENHAWPSGTAHDRPDAHRPPSCAHPPRRQPPPRRSACLRRRAVVLAHHARRSGPVHLRRDRHRVDRVGQHHHPDPYGGARHHP